MGAIKYHDACIRAHAVNGATYAQLQAAATENLQRMAEAIHKRSQRTELRGVA